MEKYNACCLIAAFFVLCILFTSSLPRIIIRRIHSYLLFLQQDEYSPSRFLKWYFKNKAFDTKITITSVVFTLITFVTAYIIKINNIEDSILIPLMGGMAAFTALYLYIIDMMIKREEDPTKRAKLPLQLTKRANKIRIVAILLQGVLSFLYLFIAISQYKYSFLFFALMAQLVPFCLILSVVILNPIEKKVRNKFLNEAREKFSRINPYVIAVVGSYGKSTVKNMLGEILQTTKGKTFWPKAGINTIMGITRQIRETLKETDKYAVIEMGTYKKGSISNVCELTPPKAAILTAINHMHLERFKTRENIYEAKTEVVKALPIDGILVCNADDDFVLRAYKEANVKDKYLYGLSKPDNIKLDAYLTDINYDINGTKAKIYWKNIEYNLKTKVVGKGGLSSLLASFTMACALGIDPKLVIAVISEIEPLSNRLVLKKYGNNLIYLEDGYNSNPLGFDSALDVLKNINVQRRIVMTPGIIELGEEQFNENYKIAKKISKICDKVIFVGDENKEAFLKAFQEENFINADFVMNRDKGFEILTSYQMDGDGVLIENDLPDWYEAKVKF